MSQKIEIDIYKPLYQQLNQITGGRTSELVTYFCPAGGFLAKPKSIDASDNKGSERQGFTTFLYDKKKIVGDKLTLLANPDPKAFIDVPFSHLQEICTEERWEELRHTFETTDPQILNRLQISKEHDLADNAMSFYMSCVMALLKLEEESEATDSASVITLFALPEAGIFNQISFRLICWHAAHGFFLPDYPFINSQDLQLQLSELAQGEGVLIGNEEMFHLIHEPLQEGETETEIADALFEGHKAFG